MRQGVIGGILAAAVIACWLSLHCYGVFFYRLEGPGLVLAPVVVGVICWLNVGLFIIAHDAMHGSLFPGKPAANLTTGRVALALYAAFSFDRLKRSHMAHHRGPGTRTDPDFDADHPTLLWPWYLGFIRRYFGLREFLTLCIPVMIYLLIGARIATLLVFWALPAMLSSLQLFFFGTYLPHRQDSAPFADRHNARTNDFGWLASLLTCFHFGYHHEHHLNPGVPWWRLPAARKTRRTPRRGLPLG